MTTTYLDMIVICFKIDIVQLKFSYFIILDWRTP